MICSLYSLSFIPPSVFTVLEVQTDRQTDRQTDGQTESITLLYAMLNVPKNTYRSHFYYYTWAKRSLEHLYKVVIDYFLLCLVFENIRSPIFRDGYAFFYYQAVDFFHGETFTYSSELYSFCQTRTVEPQSLHGTFNVLASPLVESSGYRVIS